MQFSSKTDETEREGVFFLHKPFGSQEKWKSSRRRQESIRVLYISTFELKTTLTTTKLWRQSSTSRIPAQNEKCEGKTWKNCIYFFRYFRDMENSKAFLRFIGRIEWCKRCREDRECNCDAMKMNLSRVFHLQRCSCFLVSSQMYRKLYWQTDRYPLPFASTYTETSVCHCRQTYIHTHTHTHTGRHTIVTNTIKSAKNIHRQWYHNNCIWIFFFLPHEFRKNFLYFPFWLCFFLLF